MRTLRGPQRARSETQTALRVVVARRDLPKRQMLVDLALTPNARWWVKEITPSAEVQPHGPISVAGNAASLVAAPPVYDPGTGLPVDRAGGWH